MEGSNRILELEAGITFLEAGRDAVDSALGSIELILGGADPEATLTYAEATALVAGARETWRKELDGKIAETRAKL